MASRKIGPAILALAALAGCHGDARPEPRVDRAWVRLAAVPGRPSAAYFTLTGGTEPARLVAVASPQVDTIELHETMTMGPGAPSTGSGQGPSTGSGQGMTGMQRIDGVDIAPGADVAFAPGGFHAMLFGVDPAVKPGDTIKLGFRFARGRPAMVDTRVVAAGDAAPY